MRILIVNPNTTVSMTRKLRDAALRIAAPGTEIVAVSPDFGPVSIEGYYDEAFAAPGLLAEIAKAPDMDAYIVACFDDTGLDAARCLAGGPVVGIGEAAFHMASLVAGKFSVVTTLSRSIAAIEHNLVRYGLASRCARVRASEVPVLALEDPQSSARTKLSAEIAEAIAEDGCEAIVLGCAGMADLSQSLAAEHGLPVIEGVAASVKLCEGLVALGLRTSKRGGYAAPLAKAYIGDFARFAVAEERKGTDAKRRSTP
jgi:allantoin racemase